MTNSDKHKRKRRHRKLIGRFIFTVFAIVFVFSAIFVLAATAIKSQLDKQEALNESTVNTENHIDKTVEDKRINFAIFGTDEDEIHSDVIFVVSFNTETGEASFVSVPRDTQVFMTDRMMLEMNNDGRSEFIPTKYGEMGECKITELYA